MRALLASIIGVALLTSSAALADGKLGDSAPALQIAEWVKGAQVDVTGKDKLYVVEFWATWCPPCRTSIPHLTELQKKYKDKVVFIGITDEKPDVVKPFVEKQGDKMDYVVAIDKEKATSSAYMKAFKQNGIPHAFVVDRAGQIAWHDHPMSPEFEKAIEVLVKGDKAAYDKMRADYENRGKLDKLTAEYFELISSEDADKAKARKLGEEILAAAGKNASALNEISWNMLTADQVKYRDLELALKIAKAAYDASEGKDAAIVDTYARALFDNGKIDDAIKYQKIAVELAKDDERLIGELKSALEKYEKAKGK